MLGSDDSPSPFQKKLCWAGLSSLAGLVLVLVIVFSGWCVVSACSYLKPILTPIAIAAVLAYLLTPVVGVLCRIRIPRPWAVIIVFVAFIAAITLATVTVSPSIQHQGTIVAAKIPGYSQRISNLAKESALELQSLAAMNPKTEGHTLSLESLNPDSIKLYGIEVINKALVWFQEKLPSIATSTGTFLQKSIGGVFGVLGFLLSLILVPVFLFFFLLESPAIAENWSRYLPLRASPLKAEIVSLFNEINDYLIHFFRGQLLVSLIDGAMIGLALFAFLRLDFSLLIGLMVGVLGFIPYLGIAISLIPALLIALAQYGDLMHPFWVAVIFLIANQIDGIIVSPKIIGTSVGLHPMTVIISVFAWSILLGGLLGALLAVPLTATLKVLLRRYFWDLPEPVNPPAAKVPSSGH